MRPPNSSRSFGAHRAPCESGDGALRIMYELCLRTADQDTAALAQMRTHANILLSAIVIVGALLATHFPAHTHDSAWLYLALLGLGVSGISCIAVIWPVNDRGHLPTRRSSYNQSGPHVYRERWREWLMEYILRRDRPMLWKSQITYDDLACPAGASGPRCCESVECSVVVLSSIAHSMNAGTIGRRADLVRIATGILLVSLALLIVWVIAGGSGHSSLRL